MDKFTKKIKGENNTDIVTKRNVLFSNDKLSVIKHDGWSIVKECDMVVCIIHLIEDNQFILRHEYIPTFKLIDGQEYHLTVLSGTIKQGESPKTTLLREIEEEAGIVIDPDFNIEFEKPLFVSKGCVDKYHPCIITLSEKDYHEVVVKGDGSKAEKKSKSVKLNIKYINSVNASDLITEYMMCKFKEYNNI